ncbi:endonuclease/exonuclease/phosphatase family protein [Phenylobacterium aquaticum]|uniref:endonuclease/exonuclease/phosphatase family protein n=1 Tax=Phenylobacterium aquaticum TaxID=1763816 RepID=UPI0026F2F81D|nr:endonuclease/exonuclease/phosphatase family protein [Phenylobacterium aquaticum]
MIRLALSGLAIGLVFALGLACATAALIGLCGGVNPRMDVATHFAPFWLAGALAVTAYALWLAPRDLRVTFMTLGLFGVAAAGGLMAPEYLRPMSAKAPADAPNRLKLIQFNAWEKNAEIEATAKWLTSQGADVLVVEEGSGPLIDRIAELSRYHVTCRTCGVAIFSRAAPLPKSTTPSMVRKPPLPKGWAICPPIAVAGFMMAGRDVNIIGVHTVWPTQSGLQAAHGRYLALKIAELPRDQVILTGDFNSTPWSFARRREDRAFGLERRDRALFTWPARLVLDGKVTLPFPFLPIDHVYAGSGWRTVKVRRGPRLGSDHYPVIVTLALKP